MRDYHLQTQQKPNRHSKSISDDHAKKHQKIVKKSSNAALSAVSEDLSVFESPNDSIDFTSISEISEDNLLCESSEDLTASLSIEASSGSEAVASSVLTPLSSAITFDNHEKGIASISQCSIATTETVNLSCIEAELVVKHLKEAQLQLFDAKNVDLQSKRLLNALINVIVKALYGMPKENEWSNELIPRKAYLAFLSFLLSILVASAVLIFFSGSQHTCNGPTPT